MSAAGCSSTRSSTTNAPESAAALRGVLVVNRGTVVQREALKIGVLVGVRHDPSCIDGRPMCDQRQPL